MEWTEGVLFESRMASFRIKVESSVGPGIPARFVEFVPCRYAAEDREKTVSSGFTAHQTRSAYMTSHPNEISALLDCESARQNVIWPHSPEQASRFRVWRASASGGNGSAHRAPSASIPAPESQPNPTALSADTASETAPCKEQPTTAPPATQPIQPCLGRQATAEPTFKQRWPGKTGLTTAGRGKRKSPSGRHAPYGKFVLKAPLQAGAVPEPLPENIKPENGEYSDA